MSVPSPPSEPTLPSIPASPTAHPGRGQSLLCAQRPHRCSQWVPQGAFLLLGWWPRGSSAGAEVERGVQRRWALRRLWAPHVFSFHLLSRVHSSFPGFPAGERCPGLSPVRLSWPVGFAVTFLCSSGGDWLSAAIGMLGSCFPPRALGESRFALRRNPSVLWKNTRPPVTSCSWETIPQRLDFFALLKGRVM